MKRILLATLMASLGVIVVLAQSEGARPPLPQRTWQVLAALGHDTVYAVHANSGGDSLVWVSRREARRDVWQTHRAAMTARLLDLNHDGVLDLLTFVNWEEAKDSYVYLGGPRVAKQVFQSSREACRNPDLLDVNGDGLLDIVEYTPGALPRDACVLYTPDNPACVDGVQMDWATAWVQSKAGAFVDDSVAAAAFYARQSMQYSEGARRLRAWLARPARPAGYSTCTVQTLQRMLGMAERAARIGSLPR